jgi:hypothetical protein
MLNIEDPKVLNATEQKLFTTTIWSHGFVKPCATALLDSGKDVKNRYCFTARFKSLNVIYQLMH